jgi:hypothetical protein
MPKRRRAVEAVDDGESALSCAPVLGSSSKATTTVKCSLAGLRCSPDLKFEIEDAVRRVHSIAVKGSLVATQVLLSALEAGEALPDVGSQTWWYRCFCSCGVIQGRVAGRPRPPRERKSSADLAIEAAAQELFAGRVDWTPMDFLWSFLAELSRDALTACQNMLGSVFHTQVEKAFRREMIVWEVERGREIPKSSKI